MQKSVGDDGVNVIIEMLSNVNLSNDLKLLSRGGRVIVSFVLHPFDVLCRFPLHRSLHSVPDLSMTGRWL